MVRAVELGACRTTLAQAALKGTGQGWGGRGPARGAQSVSRAPGPGGIAGRGLGEEEVGRQASLSLSLQSSVLETCGRCTHWDWTFPGGENAQGLRG